MSKIFTSSDQKPPSRFAQLKSSLTSRFVIIGILTLLMFIPLNLVSGIVYERNSYYHQVLDEIASTWGRQQIVTGPVLYIPYMAKYISHQKESTYSGEDKIIENEYIRQKVAVILPDRANIQTDINESFRQRSLYKSLVYNADSKFSGTFSVPDLTKLSDNITEIEWDKAHIAVFLGDTAAIRKLSKVTWNGASSSFKPGLIHHHKNSGFNDGQNNRLAGFHAPVQLNESSKDIEFSFEMNFNGSGNLSISPIGKETNIEISSTWPHPSFQGRMLPVSHNINKDGFTATWDVPYLTRNMPQIWHLEDYQFRPDQYAVGVKLFEPVELYTQVDRAIKYGILFIALTFITLLTFELSLNCRFHYVQYALVGAAMSIFYLILISFAEHMGFYLAYLMGAVICCGIIATYIKSALNRFSMGLVLFGILSMMYAVLYSLLQMEDFALMTGTVVILLVLVILMYLTRNIVEIDPKTE